MAENEERLARATAQLERFGLPPGLLPLADVIEVGFVEATGCMRIVQKKEVEHSFNSINKLVRYDTEIKGNIQNKKITEIKGVKAKAKAEQLAIWHPVSEINVDQAARTINCNCGGIIRAFPVEAFAAGQ